MKYTFHFPPAEVREIALLIVVLSPRNSLLTTTTLLHKISIPSNDFKCLLPAAATDLFHVAE